MVKKQNEKVKRNPILIFLFAIVIPLFILIAIGITILLLTGFDIGKWANDKNVPVISTFIPSEEEKNLENKLMSSNETIEAQRAEIEDLNREITSMESIIEELEMDIKRLENRTTDDNEDNDIETAGDIKKTASTFRNMDPEKAAAILQELNQSNMVQILSELKGDVRGAILEEMEPKTAAEVAKEMMNE